MHVEFRDERSDSQHGRMLIDAFAAEIASIYLGWDTTSGPSAEPEDMAPPHGRFVVAYAGDSPVACAGLKRLDDEAFELKRMYVAPEARGTGVAPSLLARLESLAAELGATVVRLDTGDKQPAALALYRRAGYVEIDDYNGNPYARYWMEKRL